MYNIEISPNAQKQLKNIVKKTNKDFILQIIDELKENPFLGKQLGKKLQGRYSFRIGVYRIIYRIKKEEKPCRPWKI